MQTKTPKQHKRSFIKVFLHTKLGAFIGFSLGISGFNKLCVYKNGKRVSYAFNSRVRKGGDLTASLMTGASQNSISSPLPPLYIALSTSSLTPGNTDTTLTGETSASGLGRALGSVGSYTTPSVLDGACSYILSKAFTSGATATITSAAIFDAVSTGNLFVEANLSPSTPVVSGDVLTVNWTINL